MNASQFRSHLMQQFAANARTQSRPPIALFSLSGAASSSSSNGGGGGGGGEEERPRLRQRASSASVTAVTAVTAISSRGLLPPTLSTIISSSSGHDASPPSTINSLLVQSRCSSSVAAKSSATSADEADSSSSIAAAAAAADHSRLTLTSDTQSQAAQNFQQLIASRRTVTNFLPPSPSPHPSDEQFLRDAISRGVRCAIAAALPHRKIIATEPATTFHRIMPSPSAASERLLDIAYEATLQRLLANKLSGAEACRSEATRKRERWSKIPAFLVVTAGGMEPQTTTVASAAAGNTAEDGDAAIYTELPHVPPKTMRQLEGYGAACASVQNLLLGLHAEGLGSKWATGPVIRTRAFRDLVRCREEDMVVGLIMIGRPKRLPGTRRTREVDGDVLRDVLMHEEL